MQADTFLIHIRDTVTSVLPPLTPLDQISLPASGRELLMCNPLQLHLLNVNVYIVLLS